MACQSWDPSTCTSGLASEACGERDLARTHLSAALELARVLGAKPWAAGSPACWPSSHSGRGHGTFRPDGDVWRARVRRQHGPPGGLQGAARPRRPARQPWSTGHVDRVGRWAGGAGDRVRPGAGRRRRAAYRHRIEALDAAITAAREDGDAARLQDAEEERDAIIAELRAATGLGGRARRLGDPGERARSTVTARIKEALRRIEAVHPELAAHLRDSVRTGRACVYQPAERVAWRL